MTPYSVYLTYVCTIFGGKTVAKSEKKMQRSEKKKIPVLPVLEQL